MRSSAPVLLNILKAQPGWEVVAVASDGREAIQKAADTKPDVAIIDYSLPLINGIEGDPPGARSRSKPRFSFSPCMTVIP